VRIAGWIPRASSRSSASDRASSCSAGVEPRRELDVAARFGASAGHPQVQGQRHQPLLRAVVQVAFEPSPRLVLRGDQPLA
jgi:hypothetical protein